MQPASRNVEYQRLADSGTHNGTLAMLHPLDVYEPAGWLSIVETCPQSPGVKDDELSCYAPGWPAGRESYANKFVEESRDVSDILIPVVSDLFTGCSSTFTSEFDLCPSPETTHVWHDPMVENEISLMQPATWNFEYQRRTKTGSHSRPLAVLHPHDVYDPAGWLSIVDCPHSPPQSGNGFAPEVDSPKTVVSSSKRPRGRPKKKVRVSSNPNTCALHPPPVQNSSVEAINTWNAAKMIGISSTEEAMVLSGIRKSRRLMIMDGFTG